MSMPAPTLPPPPATPSASPTATPSPSSPAAPPPQSTVPLSPVPSAPQRRRQLADEPPPPTYATPPPPATPSASPTATPSPSSPAAPPPQSTVPLSPVPSAPQRRRQLAQSPSSASPAPSAPSPPSPTTTSSSTSTGLVAGIAIGGVVLLVVFCLLFIWYNRGRRRRRENREGYHVPPPPPPQILKANDPNGGRLPHYRQEAATPQPKLSFPTTQPPLAPPLGHRPRLPPSLSSSGGSGSNNSGAEGVYHPPSPGFVLGSSKSSFTYDEIVMATDGFSDANLLGQGGFGFVHKGVLPNGKEVAVKQLKAGSGQGEREFQAEVEIISRVHHKHLVSLVGYCMTGYQRILVYEFVPNNTLEFHLHGKGRPAMDWATRLKIALGSAKGLAYLHEDCHPTIIHRDIKAANILLDFRFEVKVADFGLAKFFSDTDTHVSTRVMGTFGYLAPEYASSGKLTEKSDVFSFGVMLLELITGRRPMDPTHSCMDDSLVDWARPQLTSALEDGNFDSLADPRLQNGYNKDEMRRMVACAAACVRHSARGRPRMSQIVRALEGNASLSDLNEDIRPGRSGLLGSYGSSEYDAIKCNEALKKFQKITLASTENYGSGEHGKPTSRYGVNPWGSSSEGQTSQEMEMGKMKGSSQGFT